MNRMNFCFNFVLVAKNYPNCVPLWNARHSQAMQEKVLQKNHANVSSLLTPDFCLCPAITFCCSKDWDPLPAESRDRNIIFFEERERPASMFAR
jgi:hypothetical protein